ncbi:hypothetical protein ACMAUO_02390 [Gluconacetobacter sp. Hr-1-5]|uniref:hypothetical protein n=1 Tax=Gluconacetobacter sp. Hr-1-5 TaxID=3395370 RepID=UPI003B52A201
MSMMMRRAAVLSLLVLQTGCAGFGKVMADDATFPGANPNLPGGDAENLRRARGEGVAERPILPQGGNMWPGPPAPLPTLGDATREHHGADDDGLPADAATGPELPEGGTLSAGEQAEIRGGVQNASGQAPGSLAGQEDAAPARSGQAASTIVIPNGDGTSTVITPDGTVKTVRDTQGVSR